MKSEKRLQKDWSAMNRRDVEINARRMINVIIVHLKQCLRLNYLHQAGTCLRVRLIVNWVPLQTMKTSSSKHARPLSINQFIITIIPQCHLECISVYTDPSWLTIFVIRVPSSSWVLRYVLGVRTGCTSSNHGTESLFPRLCSAIQSVHGEANVYSQCYRVYTHPHLTESWMTILSRPF